MRYILYLSAAVLAVFILKSCSSTDARELPVLGIPKIIDGDTIPHRIPDFTFMNQDSQLVTNETFANAVYVADFFFTSCPTICPKLTRSMLRIHDYFEGREDVLFLSHTIDIRRDSIPRLKMYAENLGVTSDRWHFVTGDMNDIYDIAEDYMSIAIEDPNAPGGFDHSGWLILVDGNRHIRSFCDGTKDSDVDRLMEDIKILLHEM
ncbi:MAG: SCO family protein [Saprospirales bacterium]|jgi:protein SCO1/2|nr:MAG: SCO family protein [Saprospirales bacterium]